MSIGLTVEIIVRVNGCDGAIGDGGGDLAHGLLRAITYGIKARGGGALHAINDDEALRIKLHDVFEPFVVGLLANADEDAASFDDDFFPGFGLLEADAFNFFLTKEFRGGQVVAIGDVEDFLHALDEDVIGEEFIEQGGDVDRFANVGQGDGVL